MKIQLKWRLSKLPTPSEIVELVANKLITQEEAKEILFDKVTEEDVNKNALKKEIEFLRKVVEDLSKSKSETVRVVEKHINHYKDWTWYQPYTNWCGSTYVGGNSAVTIGGSGTTLLATNGNYTTSGLASVSSAVTNTPGFNSIKTF